jgi:pyruvate/2-oxoglutarate dehydrogenase complex dihydrolipoamide dehydrogenase (E3) component
VSVEQAEIVVLGLGTGGEDLASHLVDEGVDVVGVEPNLVGGECAYWACIPSKIMIRAGNLLAEARRVDGMAGEADVRPDWSPVAERIRVEATGNWDDSIAVARFESRGGRFVRGYARLTGPRTVVVGDRQIEATRGIVLATGSHPFIPPIPGLADVKFWTTHDAIAADPLPASLIILGGGAVGCELGQVFARFGVKVTIIEGRDRLLALEEPEASAVLESVFDREGIAVLTNRRAEHVKQPGEHIVVTLDDGSEVSAERLLVATGRSVDFSALGLDAAGLEPVNRHVQVDDLMRAGEGIWALGDITGQPMLTSVAVYHSSIIGADILGMSPAPADYRTMPRLTFTDPEIGTAGLTEAAAREAGVDVSTIVKQVPATFRGWIHGPGNDGVIKLVAERSSGVLMGATTMGPRGGDLLGMLGLAIHARLPVETLSTMMYGYPSFYGGIGEAVGAYGLGIGKVIDPDFVPGLS